MATTDPYAAYAKPVQEGPTLKQRSTEANIGQSITSTQRGQADLPYIAPTAQEQLERIILQNEQLQRELDKAKKGVPLEGDDKTRFETDVDAFARIDRAVQNFNPDFVGTVLDFPGDIENFLQRRVSGELGTPGQAAFWQEMKLLDMLQRNKYFGASLTGNEKQSYAETTISPGMTPEAALANLETRKNLLQKAIQRRVGSLRAGGYNPAQINAALGEYVPVLNPRWLSPENERILSEYASSKDFDPAVYSKMMLEMGDVNGVRLDPAQTEAAAADVAQMRSEGVTQFGPQVTYDALAEEEEKDEAAVGAGAGGGEGSEGPDGLSWGETLGSALVNLPSSTMSELGGIWDAFTSPIQTAKSLGSLGGALLSKMGVADFDEESADALGQYYVNKYGSIEGFKNELANNPASILADVATVLTGGAGVATKLGLPAKIAQLGKRAAVAQQYAGAIARNIDPITAMTNVVTKAVPAAVKGTGKVAGVVTSEALGLTTGAGGEAIREAASVGRERGLAGAPTASSEAFLEAMRNPGASADEVVQLARGAVGELRQQASQRYTDTMSRFGKNPVPLDIGKVRQRIAAIKPASYDTWRDSQGPRPSDHRAWETINEFVDEYAYKATQDPSLLEPLAMDQFKQDLYDIGSKVGGAYDKDAARIAGTAYGAVKDELVKHDPVYAGAMKDYENAAKEAQQLESAFGLAAARGKQPNIETAGRKLTSIFRNNVNTNYGTRTAQAERLAELDPTDTLFPSLAGQSLSATAPRGIQRALAGTMASSGITGLGLNMIPMAADVPGYLSGYNLAALPLTSPRLMGEAAYYAGRGSGMASKALEPVTTRIASTADRLADLQQRYRDPLVYGGFAAQNIEAMQGGEPIAVEEQVEETVTPEAMRIAAEPPALPELTSKYGGPMVDVAGNEVAPAEAPGPEAGDMIVVDNRDAIYDPVAKAFVFVDTGEIARKAMQRGGAVKGYKGGGLLDYLPDAEDVKGFGRSVAEGALYGYNDNVEALLRAGLDKKARQRVLDDIRREQSKYEKEHGGYAALGNILGGVGTAFVPGMQGLSAARVARMGPKARAAYELALGTAQGGLYGTGKMYDDPDSKRDPLAVLVSETASGTLGYPASRGVAAVGRRARDFVVPRVRRSVRR